VKPYPLETIPSAYRMGSIQLA